jgi:hypothetical protein
MRERRMVLVRLLVGALVLSSTLLVVLYSLSAKGGSGPQTPAELWLSWNSDARAEFVWGYLSGFVEGKRAACSFYADKITLYTPNKPVSPEELPRQACLNALPDFPKPSKEYVDGITNYYKKYPNDRQAGMSRVLLELASPQGLTIDQIHAKLTQ